MVVETINNTEKEILIKRSAVRTMAKDIKALSEQRTSQRQEDFLNISKDVLKDIKKTEFKTIPKENKKLLAEKEKIQELINRLSQKKEDPFKKNIAVEHKKVSSEVSINKGKEEKHSLKEQSLKAESVSTQEDPEIKLDFQAKERDIKTPKKQELEIELDFSAPQKEIKKTKKEEPEIKLDFQAKERKIKIEKPSKSIPELIEDIDKKITTIEEGMIELKAKVAPFEKNKAGILEQIEKSKSELKDIKKQEKEIQGKKEVIEKEEASAELEKKREIEKTRWSIEKQRDTIEKERYAKEDEQKSLKLQLKEVDISAEKLTKAIKGKEKEIEELLKQKERYNLLVKKDKIEESYKQLEGLYESSKNKLLKNTGIKEAKEAELDEALMSERGIEGQILELEEKIKVIEDVVEKRRLESDRRDKEEERKNMERNRWNIEDGLVKIKEERKKIKEEYKELMIKKEKLEAELEKISKEL